MKFYGNIMYIKPIGSMADIRTISPNRTVCYKPRVELKGVVGVP